MNTHFTPSTHDLFGGSEWNSRLTRQTTLSSMKAEHYVCRLWDSKVHSIWQSEAEAREYLALMTEEGSTPEETGCIQKITVIAETI